MRMTARWSFSGRLSSCRTSSTSGGSPDPHDWLRSSCFACLRFLLPFVPTLSGAYIMQGLTDMIANRRVAETAVADCAKRFPDASHSVLP